MKPKRTTTQCLAAFLAALALAGVPLAASGSDDERGHAEEGAEHGEPDTVLLSNEQHRALGIEVTTLGPGRIDSGIELLGEVHPNGDRLAHIVPRFPGIVREVRPSSGDAVRIADVLAVIASSDSLAPYELKTLIDGVVLTRHMTRGEAVDRETEAFVVADLSTVWVDLSVYQKDLGQVRVGQGVRIHSVHGGPDAEGAISYLTPAVDRTTRTAVARSRCPMPSARGFRDAPVITLDAREAPLVVPRSAIQSYSRTPSVCSHRKRVRRASAPGQEGESFVEIVRSVCRRADRDHQHLPPQGRAREG